MNKNLIQRIALMLCVLMVLSVPALAESLTPPASDPSPAIYVYQKTNASVVGVFTQEQQWIREYQRVQETTVASGSGVVIREGGYILTNNHVIEDGSAYQILLPSGEKVSATLVGADSSTDIAVLKLDDEEAASQLVPVEMGSTAELMVGSTVIAIGNPGGEDLANTVTQGIVSALERSNVSASSGSRAIAYIQHDAAINSGNSGGGLFNYKGQLVGINTLKMAGSAYSQITFEGLGFAIPIETITNISDDLIEYGKVRRATMGVGVAEYYDGPEEPMRGYAPSGVYVTQVMEGTPAEEAGFKLYDCIYSLNGVRTHTYAELTTQLDQYDEGDTVEVEVVRYGQIQPVSTGGSSLYDYYFGGGSTSSGTTLAVDGGYEIIKLNVTLKYLD